MHCSVPSQRHQREAGIRCKLTFPDVRPLPKSPALQASSIRRATSNRLPKFVIPGEEGRLAAGLRGVLLANTTRPVEILAQSALAFLRGDDAFGRALDDLADRRNCLRELPLTAAARL